ncbi:hypothetical protein ACFZB9_31480 [Kitasatospora sp. NPDC008050]
MTMIRWRVKRAWDAEPPRPTHAKPIVLDPPWQLVFDSEPDEPSPPQTR